MATFRTGSRNNFTCRSREQAYCLAVQEASPEEEFAEHRALLNSEVNAIIRKASFYAAILPYFSGLLMAVLQFSGVQQNLQVPILWSMIVGTICAITYFLARKQWIHGWRVYAVMFSFATAPGIIYILAYFLLPSGTATYITGPPSYVYFFTIVLSGFTFNARLSTWMGLYCGVQYFFFYMLSREHLMVLQGPDPLMLQDLREPPFYFFKGLIMFFGGFTVGILNNYAARLIGKILKQEKEATMLGRLFGQFVSSAVKDRLIKERAGLRGERQRVAILFSDLVGFSSYSEGREPEEIVEHLNAYFDAMVGAIHAREGTVDKFIGDAIMAIFGGVVPLENPCQAAFDSALLMRTRLQEINASWEAQNEVGFANRIGIHYGDVLLGPIGSQERKDYTVIGDNVNVAARLEALCTEKQVELIISQDVYASLNEVSRNLCLHLGQVQVKGRREPVILYGVADASLA